MSVPMWVCVDKIVDMCSCKHIYIYIYIYICLYMYVCVVMPVSVLSACVVSC